MQDLVRAVFSQKKNAYFLKNKIRLHLKTCLIFPIICKFQNNWKRNNKFHNLYNYPPKPNKNHQLCLCLSPVELTELTFVNEKKMANK